MVYNRLYCNTITMERDTAMSKEKGGISTKRTPKRTNDGAYLLTSGVNTEVIAGSKKALEAYVGVARGVGGDDHRYATSYARDTYKDTSPNTSVRNQFTRQNYEYFRPSEAVAVKPHDIIAQCMEAYRRVGIVRNIVDLMGDFCVKGIKITHPNPRIQKFYRGWYKRVMGPERSERAANYLYRCGVFVIKRTMAKANVPTERSMRTQGADKVVLTPDGPMPQELKTQKRNIPIRYNFLNPLTLEVVGGVLSMFVGKQFYALKVTGELRNALTSPRTELERELIKAVPAEIREAISRGQNLIPLDQEKLRALHYKKDDWQEWADPMIYAVMDDLILYEKMKLADLAALDGAISQIRVWTLGDIEKEIFPTDAAINKLADILLANPGGGAFDLIWGPELKVQNYHTNVHEFLGNEKYVPVMNAIYAGLGVPPTLTGASTASGFTNNYISLQTLVQRLEYGRERLKEFWHQEIELVRQAMGFQRPARIEFDHMTLSDENAEKALMIQLVDRDIMTVETLLERFGEHPEFEELRHRKEKRQRDSKLLPAKAGPWHTPEKVYELVKTALGRGYVSPEQAGIDIPEDMEGDKTPFQQQMDMMAKKNAQTGGTSTTTKKSGQPQQGRPTNSKDSTQRQQRTPKPVGASIDDTAAFMTTMLWAKDAQQEIAEIIHPQVLKFYNKKNMRSLSAEEAAIVERTKFAVLSELTPFQEVSDETLQPILEENRKTDKRFSVLSKKFTQGWIAERGKSPTMEESRSIHAVVYSLMNANTNTEKFNVEN